MENLRKIQRSGSAQQGAGISDSYLILSRRGRAAATKQCCCFPSSLSLRLSHCWSLGSLWRASCCQILLLNTYSTHVQKMPSPNLNWNTSLWSLANTFGLSTLARSAATPLAAWTTI
ncbi:hypothetical protein WJX84_007360 [Apatococcus fuscideae]|uniref:Uncharacterized protein n=1 Tax=Apatococcus fuscideae TaxID=2026836 RepID=A0AAW1RP69_9CHLO